MKVDTTDTKQMEAFYRGILSKVDVDHEDKIVHAQQAGYQIGQQIEQLTGNVSKDYYAADPGKTLSSAIIGNAIIGALMGENEYSMADARALFEAQMEVRQKDNLERLYGANRKAGEEFLAANAKKPGVVVLPSGLQYKVLTQGNGPIPKSTSTVKVHYEGHLIDGTEFDSSYKRNEPNTLGVRQVIKGWNEALCLMPVGSKWELYIPQELAYGDRDQGKIKPFSALIFTVELLSIEK
jgi:FKBP-type peptidyl-prolyl cis-trans isomerase FklB